MGRKRKRTGNGGNGGRISATYHQEDTSYFDQPPVEGAHRYNYSEDLPWDFQKYWKQRFDFFSRYNDGVWMTEDSWFEVTPEAIANKISAHAASALPDGKPIIVDMFCGVGGNAIAFALSGKFKRVYAIEKNKAALACAQHNAKVYGVDDRITWFAGDCFELLGIDDNKKQNSVSALQQVISHYGVVFASPPWGGPTYKDSDIFDLDKMQPYSLSEIYTKVSRMTKNMILYLPRTSDLRQISDCVDDGAQAQVVHYCTYNNSRAMCVYLGDWKQLNLEEVR